MKLNYIMLPEDFQPRSRPGDRVKKVSETLSPMSRAGRRVQGEAKAMATVAGNAKKEDRAKEFTKFVKTLNKKVAGQRRAAPPAIEAVEDDSVPKQTRTSERLERLTEWLARSSEAARSGSLLSSKREAAKSATEPIWRRAVRRVKVKIAMSSTVNVPRPYNPVNQNHVVVDTNATVQHQTLVDPTDAILINEGTPYHQLPGADTIQNQFPVPGPFHSAIVPRLAHNIMAHQDLRFPGPETHYHDYLELERTAIACAYMGMDHDESMDLSPDFPSPVVDDDDRDLERTAVACAYAAMNDPMDTTLDDTLGPMAHVMHQNVPHFINLVQEPQFDHTTTFQQPVYETLRPPGHQHLIDHLWPLAYAHVDNQIPPQPHQRSVNENLLPHYHHQAGQHPQGDLGFLAEFGHNGLIHPVVQQVFYEHDVRHMTPDQPQAEIYHHYIDHDVHFHPSVQQERFDQGPIQQYLNGLVPDVGDNWNGSEGLQHAGAEGQHDNPGFFLDEFGGNVVEQEEPNEHTDEAYIPDWIEDLFGDSGEEDSDTDDIDDDDDDELEEHELQTIF